MKPSLLAASMLLILANAYGQFKYDNVLFKTVYPQELCNKLSSQQDYLLLDVRSAGEFYDTSASLNLNLGHLKNARNINVRELGNRISEISNYKDKPVYVYCSHSQRSRRASKMLADSGFTNVININGGLTGIKQLPGSDCKEKLIESSVPYKVISPQELCYKTKNASKGTYIVDVRSDSAYNHISRDARANAFGRLRNSVHIPLAKLNGAYSTLPRDKEIILVDVSGSEASQAANQLAGAGFTNVSVLMEGIDRFLSSDSRMVDCKGSVFIPAAKFEILGTADFRNKYANKPALVYLDVRSIDEYNNKHKDGFRNIGHIRDAINIPAAELKTRIAELENVRNKTIVMYAFSGNNEVFQAAAMLMEQGFDKVVVLSGGLFNIRWTAGNVKGYENLKDLVVDIPTENL